MKIIRSSLKQTSLTCPSSWEGVLEDGRAFEIYFRLGRLDFKIAGRLQLQTEKDEFDITSYIELEEALKLLSKEGIEN